MQQAGHGRSNLAQEIAPGAIHIGRMRNTLIGAFSACATAMENPMKVRSLSVRRPVRWALLPAVAVIGVLAGLPTAFAYDQQATDDAIDNANNWSAARGGAYAQSPDEGQVYAPRHYRSHR